MEWFGRDRPQTVPANCVGTGARRWRTMPQVTQRSGSRMSGFVTRCQRSLGLGEAAWGAASGDASLEIAVGSLDDPNSTVVPDS